MRSIKRFSPVEKLYQYLKETLISSKSLRIEEVKEIFLRALKDYFDGNTDLNCLATVATQLYYELKQPQEIDTYDRELGKALSDATEIDWDSEHRPKNVFKGEIKLLRNYYKKNKNLLKTE